MFSFTVCVEFDDLLAITLPRNMRHFDTTVIVTSSRDSRTCALAGQHGADVFLTEAFWDDEAIFNKGLALEKATSVLGVIEKSDWIAVWDADTILPASADFSGLVPGNIYGATRRILEHPKNADYYDAPAMWENLPRGIDSYPWGADRVTLGGHLMVFHTRDPVLDSGNWFPMDWAHAGGFDSDFIGKWPSSRQRRLPFDVLHLGLPGRNWMGRITDRLDGVPIHNRAAREKAHQKLINQRAQTLDYSKEKVGGLRRNSLF